MRVGVYYLTLLGQTVSIIIINGTNVIIKIDIRKFLMKINLFFFFAFLFGILKKSIIFASTN